MFFLHVSVEESGSCIEKFLGVFFGSGFGGDPDECFRSGWTDEDPAGLCPDLGAVDRVDRVDDGAADLFSGEDVAAAGEDVVSQGGDGFFRLRDVFFDLQVDVRMNGFSEVSSSAPARPAENMRIKAR